MRRIGKRGVVAAACLVAALSAPAAAQAEPSWQALPDPPGRIALDWDGGPASVQPSVVGTKPYVSSQDPASGLTVWRLTGSRTRWVQVGGRLDDPGAEGSIAATLVSDGSTVWAAWLERTDGVNRVRLARLVGRQWQPIAAGSTNRPGMQAADFQVAAVGGRVYVALVEEAAGSRELRVLRVAEDGSSYEPLVNGLVGAHGAESPRLGVAGGRLHLAYRPGGGDGAADRLARLADGGMAWEQLAAVDRFVHQMIEHDGALHASLEPGVSRWTGAAFQGVGGWPFEDALPRLIASAGGVLYAAAGTSPGPDTIGRPRYAAFDGGDWHALPAPPSDPEDGISPMTMAEAPGGGLWAFYAIPDNGYGNWGPDHVHLAHYGEPLAPGVDGPEDAPPANPPAPPENPPAAPGSGGFTHPDGDPAPGPRPHRRGACAKTLRGTAARDLIVGRALGERILGGAGADRLFGRAGRDCIWGGIGDDLVSGGAAADALSGGSGDDRIVTGSGRDDVSAGSGDDVIDAVGGGVDRVNCGRGSDTVRVSRNDLIKGCERVRVARR